jgi:SAM-dependent methyltransferase
VREQFLREYATIRHAEGRGTTDPAYYRALPFQDVTGRNAGQWEIRGRTYRKFAADVLPEFELAAGRSLRILDLGAGTGWLAWRLGERGHLAVAVDIFLDERDGLGARVHFPLPPQALAAGFDDLPFADGAFDLAIFNSSVHYSCDYLKTLREARRVLARAGAIVILDSPVYDKPEHGLRMRAERQAFFERTYGFRSEALGSIEFLDKEALAMLARELRLKWERIQPWYGWRWAMRPWRARLRGDRPPSRFCILVGRPA